MQPLTVAEMRDIERKAFARGITAIELVERAGKACAMLIESKLGRRNRIAVFCGPGNNGADGLACALYLAPRNTVSIVMPLMPASEAGKIMFQRAKDADLDFVSMDDVLVLKPAIIVDALLGIGARPGPEGAIKEACKAVNANALDAFIISIDVPTGMAADNGLTAPDAILADATICIHAPKKGVVKAGPSKTGELWIVDIGL